MNVYTLNTAGQAVITSAIEAVTHNNDSVVPSAWFGEAEDAACGFDAGQDCCIEVGQRYTKTGNPVVIELKIEWFDVEAVE